MEAVTESDGSESLNAPLTASKDSKAAFARFPVSASSPERSLFWAEFGEDVSTAVPFQFNTPPSDALCFYDGTQVVLEDSAAGRLLSRAFNVRRKTKS